MCNCRMCGCAERIAAGLREPEIMINKAGIVKGPRANVLCCICGRKQVYSIRYSSLGYHSKYCTTFVFFFFPPPLPRGQ